MSTSCGLYNAQVNILHILFLTVLLKTPFMLGFGLSVGRQAGMSRHSWSLVIIIGMTSIKATQKYDQYDQYEAYVNCMAAYKELTQAKHSMSRLLTGSRATKLGLKIEQPAHTTDLLRKKHLKNHLAFERMLTATLVSLLTLAQGPLSSVDYV
ncbi:hypothetical protein QTP86_000693 [Hemibagrus guttatus]|nr:hypothetical protein QTP86_000693 [Hemibagrus guttatus]